MLLGNQALWPPSYSRRMTSIIRFMLLHGHIGVDGMEGILLQKAHVG